MAFHIETRVITPAFARELLGRNAENQRNIRPLKIDQYARDMAAGAWPITGDTIKIDKNKRLIDGQHRLAALVQADTPVEMLIAWDVDPSVMPLLDIGAARKFSDVLKMDNVTHRTATAAIVRRVLMWESGNRMGSGGSVFPQPTHAELLMRHQKDVHGFDSAASRGDDVRVIRLGTAGTAGACFYLFSQLDCEAAHRFFDAFVSGANLAEGSPILALRNRMVRVGRDERLTPAEMQALYIRAWNAWREDRTLASVPITTGGRKLTNANYPIPK